MTQSVISTDIVKPGLGKVMGVTGGTDFPTQAL